VRVAVVGRRDESLLEGAASADAGAVASIGTVGDSYANAQAESLIGLYKTECAGRDSPFRDVNDLELATCSWVA